MKVELECSLKYAPLKRCLLMGKDVGGSEGEDEANQQFPTSIKRFASTKFVTLPLVSQ